MLLEAKPQAPPGRAKATQPLGGTMREKNPWTQSCLELQELESCKNLLAWSYTV